MACVMVTDLQRDGLDDGEDQSGNGREGRGHDWRMRCNKMGQGAIRWCIPVRKRERVRVLYAAAKRGAFTQRFRFRSKVF